MQGKDIKRGMIVVYNDAPCLIESIAVQSPSARGGNTIHKFRARNVLTKQKVDINLRGGESLQEADFTRRPVKLMYSDGTQVHSTTPTSTSMRCRRRAGGRTTVYEGRPGGPLALIYNDQCVGIQLPNTVELKITLRTRVRGDSATAQQADHAGNRRGHLGRVSFGRRSGASRHSPANSWPACNSRLTSISTLRNWRDAFRVRPGGFGVRPGRWGSIPAAASADDLLLQGLAVILDRACKLPASPLGRSPNRGGSA